MISSRDLIAVVIRLWSKSKSESGIEALRTPVTDQNKIKTHKRFKKTKTKKNTLFIRRKTQHANFRGNPLYQATKRHSNKSLTEKKKKKKKTKKNKTKTKKQKTNKKKQNKKNDEKWDGELNHWSIFVLSSAWKNASSPSCFRFLLKQGQSKRCGDQPWLSDCDKRD